MDILDRTIKLTDETAKVLEDIRAGASNPLCGGGPETADAFFGERIKPILEDTGMPMVMTMQYGWFLRELAKLWRKRTGRDLAFHLELCLRKWNDLGLEPRTIQFLVCEVYYALSGREPEARRSNNDSGPTPETGSPNTEVRTDPASAPATGNPDCGVPNA